MLVPRPQPEAIIMGLRGDRYWDFDNPDPSAFDPEDTAYTLANAPRYGGNYKTYTVAQHAVLVARVVAKAGGDPPQILAAVHHDDSEIVTGDMPAPWKRWLRTRTSIVDTELLRIESAICTRYQIDIHDELVKWADNLVYRWEVMRMVPQRDRWKYEPLPDPEESMLPYRWFVPWTSEKACAEYLDIHEKMTRLINEGEVTDEFTSNAS